MQRLAHVLEPILCHRPHPSALRNNQCSGCKIKKSQLGKKRVNLGTALTAILPPGPNFALVRALCGTFLSSDFKQIPQNSDLNNVNGYFHNDYGPKCFWGGVLMEIMVNIKTTNWLFGAAFLSGSELLSLYTTETDEN